MADNAPFSVNRPPFPNVVIGHAQRVECHIAAITVSGGTPAVDTTRSTGGITVTDTNTGRITVGFPAGGTGAVGWTVASLIELSTPSGQVSMCVDSDLDDYAAGTLELDTFDEDDTSGIATAGDISGTVVLMIFVLKAVV